MGKLIIKASILLVTNYDFETEKLVWGIISFQLATLNKAHEEKNLFCTSQRGKV